MIFFYQTLTRILSPCVHAWLKFRLLRGKEDASRLQERFGFAGAARPVGKLIWLHAASVGESLSLLPLIDKLKTNPVLLTTGTVTSAALLKERLPSGVIHQFVPVDTPQAVNRFMAHWRPDVAVFTESELWPNLILQAQGQGAKLALINARMSEKSFRHWRLLPEMIRPLLDAFSLIAAQTSKDAARLAELAGKSVDVLGNLKFDAAPLACSEMQKQSLLVDIGPRPLWVAASVHPGEDVMVAQAHQQIKARFPDLLTILIPRHPERGGEMARICTSHASKIAVRSRGEEIVPDTEIYIADTMGELGLWYHLSEIVFIGGSLVAHGGQNPLEPARIGCAILFGPYMENFDTMKASMLQADAAMEVPNQQDLARAVAGLLVNQPRRRQLVEAAKRWVNIQPKIVESVAARLQSL